MDEHAGDTVHGKAIISTRSWRQTWVPKFPFYPKFTEPQWHSDIGINFTIEGQRQLSSCFIRIPGVSLQTFPVLVIHFFFFFNISHDTAYHRREFIIKKTKSASKISQQLSNLVQTFMIQRGLFLSFYLQWNDFCFSAKCLVINGCDNHLSSSTSKFSPVQYFGL